LAGEVAAAIDSDVLRPRRRRGALARLAIAAGLLLVVSSGWYVYSATRPIPTVLDAFALARARRDGDMSISQARIDSTLARAVEIRVRGGGT
jgi:hypothetical protein